MINHVPICKKIGSTNFIALDMRLKLDLKNYQTLVISSKFILNGIKSELELCK